MGINIGKYYKIISRWQQVSPALCLQLLERRRFLFRICFHLAGSQTQEGGGCGTILANRTIMAPWKDVQCLSCYFKVMGKLCHKA